MKSASAEDGATSGRDPAGSFLDAAAAVSLLGDVYPVSVAELFYAVESALESAERGESPGLGPKPSQFVEHNLAGGASGAGGGFQPRLLPASADLAATYDPTKRFVGAAFQPYAEVDQFEVYRIRPAPLLHVTVPCLCGVTRSVTVPLQFLMTGWGPVENGWRGWVHGIDLYDPHTGGHVERWRLVGASMGDWMAPMERQEREIRAGTDRQFKEAWQDYAGPCSVVLSSHLACVGETDEAILAWESEAIQRYLDAGISLNLVPGGTGGFGLLAARGIGGSEPVSLASRDNVVRDWVRSGKAEPWCPPIPHLLGPGWIDAPTYFARRARTPERPTPATKCRGQVLTLSEPASPARGAGAE